MKVGIKAGTSYGSTDELGYFVTEGKVGIHDLQATILQLLGLDAWKLSYPYQGLGQRLIGPEGDAKIRFWTTDLTAEYVRLNADYRT